ncbi:DNA primase [Candidatus Saccharibacteria bacterium]|nr:DNA primase [Candidatus Saccharibacteria bacterium]
MDAVEDIKQRLAIEDVIGEYVTLKRAGRNFKGLSPFSNEKTASFIVSPEKQIWHDFSSGKGGSMFSFVMEVEGLDFKGSLEHLARKAGIDLSQYQSGRTADTGKLKQRLHEVLDTATRFYQVQFSKHQSTLEYVLKTRGYTKETALLFRLGYAPNNGTALLDYMTRKDFTEKELSQAGLTSKRYHGVGDMFRGRLMIPLQDAQGQVIGFTARLLEDIPDAPKYINTPQTLLYDKSRHIYGLHLAKESIRKSGYAVLVEGNLDVIASHQAGVRQVVATAGTAMTEPHLKTLKRFTGDIRLAYDADKAGQAATERAIPIASKVGVELSMVTIPSGKDPDDLIKQDPKIWQQVITKHQNALDWLIERYREQLDLETAVGKRQFSDVTLAVVKQLPDKVDQEHFMARIAKIIGVSTDALQSKMRADIQAPRKRSKTVQPQSALGQADQAKNQNHFLSLMLMQPALRSYLEPITEDMFTEDAAKQVCSFLLQNPSFSGDAKEAAVLRNISDYAKILGLQFEELYQGIELLELRNEAARLQTRVIEQYVKTKKQPLIEAMRDAGEPDRTRLLSEAKALDELLN